MATYECSKCGMSVNATCAKCNAQLVNDTLKLDDDSKVQISKCPNNHGKIKSPVCCGQDMTCSVNWLAPDLATERPLYSSDNPINDIYYINQNTVKHEH